jgi:hypothetical protein
MEYAEQDFQAAQTEQVDNLGAAPASSYLWQIATQYRLSFCACWHSSQHLSLEATVTVGFVMAAALAGLHDMQDCHLIPL